MILDVGPQSLLSLNEISPMEQQDSLQPNALFRPIRLVLEFIDNRKGLIRLPHSPVGQCTLHLEIHPFGLRLEEILGRLPIVSRSRVRDQEPQEQGTHALISPVTT
jgi:hypothetical protein